MVRMKKPKKQKQVFVVMDGEHTSTDWRFLRTQKETLCKLASASVLNIDVINDLDGVISLIDHIQDSAAAVLGDKAVFGNT